MSVSIGTNIVLQSQYWCENRWLFDDSWYWGCYFDKWEFICFSCNLLEQMCWNWRLLTSSFSLCCVPVFIASLSSLSLLQLFLHFFVYSKPSSFISAYHTPPLLSFRSLYSTRKLKPQYSVFIFSRTLQPELRQDDFEAFNLIISYFTKSRLHKTRYLRRAKFNNSSRDERKKIVFFIVYVNCYFTSRVNSTFNVVMKRLFSSLLRWNGCYSCRLARWLMWDVRYFIQFTAAMHLHNTHYTCIICIRLAWKCIDRP